MILFGVLDGQLKLFEGERGKVDFFYRKYVVVNSRKWEVWHWSVTREIYYY
jgi:hypothetical protein